MISVQDLTIPTRCLVMGIVNVTADSFSDGGEFLEVDAAIQHSFDLVKQGADMIDVGAESTRPGANRVDPDLEIQRVVPVIEALHQEGIRTSVDTMRAATAAAAAEAGVDLLNDVSGGLADPDMYRVMAQTGLPVCLMHWKTSEFGDAAGRGDHGDDIVKDVQDTFDTLVDNALAAGVAEENIILDPGLGFAKSPEDNWTLLKALPRFLSGRFPILVGASRKRFLTGIRSARSLPSQPKDADAATAAVTALCAQLGVWGVRVHNVVISRDAVDAVAEWNCGGLHD